MILDADGVLIRLPDGRTLDGLDPLEAFLSLPAYSDVLIVAAGEWKRYLSLAAIRRLFSEDLRERIVDTTPEVESTDMFRSHVEIYAWLDEHPEIGAYLVLESSAYATNEPCMDNASFVQWGDVLSEADYWTLRF